MLELEDLKRIAELEFADIVKFTVYVGRKLRIYFADESFLDVHISKRVLNRFAFHYERRHIDKTIYRYDNVPDSDFKNLASFPYHFHYEIEENVLVPEFKKDIKEGFRSFLGFIINKFFNVKWGL